MHEDESLWFQLQSIHKELNRLPIIKTWLFLCGKTRSDTTVLPLPLRIALKFNICLFPLSEESVILVTDGAVPHFFSPNFFTEEDLFRRNQPPAQSSD